MVPGNPLITGDLLRASLSGCRVIKPDKAHLLI